MPEPIIDEVKLMSPEEVTYVVTVAKDSVWVINDEISKLSNGGTWDNTVKGNIERNVAHLEIVLDKPEVASSGLDLSELTAAITAGNQELSNHV